jgi:hypothetical protein
MHDKDIQSLMKNLTEDATRFRSSFNAAVAKSTIRKTSQEKDAKALVAQFQKQTEGLLSQFKSTKKADGCRPWLLVPIKSTTFSPPLPWATKPTVRGLE